MTRKAFTAAVTRAMIPGSKYDNMLILAGPQGLGKSTLLDKMSRGWFNDSIRTFEGKEASELLQGVWLVEISELDAFRRTDVARIKQFLSLRTDRFRAAYGRHVKELPRCCVFFGTTNTKDFLQDRTGNRRFWPVDVGVAPVTKGVWTDLPGEIDQLWAEAKVRWQLGEPLYLSGELEEAAKAAKAGSGPVVETEPLAEESVDFDTFCKSDFRAVKVLSCERVKKSEKLLKFTLDDGTGTPRQILSGIAKWYAPEDLAGKTLVAIVNLPPRKIMGQESQGMLISAVHTVDGEEMLNLLMIDDKIPAGAKLC